MLGQFAKLHRWVDIGDVLQNSLLRLLRALEEARPDSMRQFFALAAEQMRRELLDLARHYRGDGTENRNVDDSDAAFDPSDPATRKLVELENWAAFHEEVTRLATKLWARSRRRGLFRQP